MKREFENHWKTGGIDAVLNAHLAKQIQAEKVIRTVAVYCKRSKDI